MAEISTAIQPRGLSSWLARVPRSRLGIPESYSIRAAASRERIMVTETTQGPTLFIDLSSPAMVPSEAVEEAFALVNRFSALCQQYPALPDAIGVHLVTDQ